MKDQDLADRKALGRCIPAKNKSMWRTIRNCLFPARVAEGPPDWHTLLALSMVIIATVGAIVAGGAAIAEQEANRLERLLTWGHEISLTKRQVLLADAATRAGLEVRIKSLDKQGEAYLEAANHPGVNQVWLKSQAQEEFAAARALLPFLTVLPNPFQDKQLSVENNFQKAVAFYLAGLGFGTVWRDPLGTIKEQQATGPPNIWEPLDQKLEDAHLMVRRLASGVVLFVAALILLTLANILSHRQFLQNKFFVLGWLTVFGATVFVGFILFRHWELISDLVVILRAQGFSQLVIFLAPPLLLVVLLVWASINFLHKSRQWYKSGRPREEEKTGPQDEEMLEAEAAEARQASGFLSLREAPDEFSRCTVLLIAITVFWSAVCGLGYSYSASMAGTAAHGALKSMLEMDSRSSRTHTTVNHLLVEIANLQEQSARRAVVLQRSQDEDSLRGNDSPGLGKILVQVQDRALHDKTSQELSELLGNPYSGAEADLWFPEKLKWLGLRSLINNWWEPFAQWDAFSQRSLAWHAKAQIFLGILTVLAMATYLFAQAHGMGEGTGGNRLIRNGLRLLKIAVLCFGIILVSSLVEFYQTGTAKEVQAAQSYAIAEQRRQTAQNPQDFQVVINFLENTIAKNPNFGRAHLALASALNDVRSSQSGEGYVSLPTKDQLPLSIAHQEKALQVLKASGYAEPAALLSGLGFDTLLLALEQKHLPEVQTSLAYLQKAREKASEGGNLRQVAMLGWNLALARLASGKSHEIPPETIHQIVGMGDHRLLVSCFTDLELVEKYYVGLHPGRDCRAVVAKAKEQLVGAWPQPKTTSTETTPLAPECGDRATGSPSLEVSPQTVQWRGKLPQIQTGRDRLVLVWYAKDPDWGVWRALPEVSNPVAADELIKAENPTGSRVIPRSYLAGSNYRNCLKSGQYKAELYLNGTLTGPPPETTGVWGEVEPKRLLALNVGLCLPKSWISLDIPPELGDIAPLVHGYQSPDRQPAAFVFTFYASQSRPDADKSAAVKRAQNLLTKGPWGITDAEVFIPYTPGGCKAVPGGTRGLYRQWSTREGVQHVGIVLLGATPLCELCNTLDSMGDIYNR